MANVLCLTNRSNGNDIWVNMDRLVYMYVVTEQSGGKIESFTRMLIAGQEQADRNYSYLQVVEKPKEMLKMMKEN